MFFGLWDASALEAISEHSFAAAIVNVEMPSLSGAELGKKIRETPDNKYLPILGIIPANLQTISWDMEVFSDGMITKPFKSTQVMYAIKTCMP